MFSTFFHGFCTVFHGFLLVFLDFRLENAHVGRVLGRPGARGAPGRAHALRRALGEGLGGVTRRRYKMMSVVI